MKTAKTLLPLLISGLGLAPLAYAKATPEQVASLDDANTTCMGAPRAGNADGSIPAFSDKWTSAWPGAPEQGYSAGPYADEKPLFVITAKNMQQHAQHLTEGQKTMLQRFPEQFRMPVYPSHRDFTYPDWVCQAVKDNAEQAELMKGGQAFSGVTGGVPFPFPASGLEAQWNIQNPHRAWTEQAIVDQAVVYADGDTARGRVHYRILSPWNNPNERGSNLDRVNAFFNIHTLLPERDKGSIVLGWQPNDTTVDRQTYFYKPGIRRVRQAPEFGFDTPQGAGGFRTVDDDRIFNGSPIRYNWELLDKREIYVPYNVFKINDPSLSYDALLTPNTVNPKHMRYERHRVWRIKATLKDNYRHIYKTREIYVDEDTWHPLWADNYDTRDELWRVSFVTYFWSPAMAAYQAGVSIYHDLTANAYFADRLVNESKQWWILNRGDLKPKQFSPNAAKRQGH